MRYIQPANERRQGIGRAARPSLLALCAAAALALAPNAAVGGRQAAGGVPDIIEKAAHNQGLSLYARDRCRYEQRLLMERYRYDKKRQAAGELLAKRQTTVVVEPAPEPDETGQVPVVVRVVADTNDRGEPREKVDPDANTGLASGALLDQIFFPLLPENLPYLAFEEIASGAEGERWFRFAPRPGAVPQPARPLATGVAQLDAATGEVLTVRIDGLANLRAVDKRLEKILSITAKIDYSQFGGRYRMPTVANGSGVSDVSRFQGLFRFVFEEGKYAPSMKID